MDREELIERDPTKPNTEQGLYRKFDVRRTDGSDEPGGKHDGCDYFVLDVTHDPLARAALEAYANAAEAAHPQLAADMRSRYAIEALAQQAPQGAVDLCETCGLRQPTPDERMAALNMLADYNPGTDEFSEALEVLRCAVAQAPTAGGVTDAMVEAGAALSTSGRKDDPRYRAKIRAILEAAFQAQAPDVGRVQVVWERKGNCLWHVDCPNRGMFKEERKEQNQSLLRCVACGVSAWVPHGLHDKQTVSVPATPDVGRLVVTDEMAETLRRVLPLGAAAYLSTSNCKAALETALSAHHGGGKEG